MGMMEAFRAQEQMKVNPRLNEIVQARYQSCMQRHNFVQKMAQQNEFDTRMERRDGAIEAVRQKFLAMPFGTLALKDTDNASILKVQGLVQKMADRAVLLQEKMEGHTTISKTWNEGFGSFRGELQAARAALDTLHKSPVSSGAQDNAAIEQLEQVITQYESLVPRGLYYDRTKTGGDKILADKGGIVLRLLGVTLAGAYTAYAAIAGWKQGNMAPALLGTGVTAALIFGPKRLLEGKGDAVVRQTEFLGTDEYARFISRYNLRGKEAAQAIEELQGQASKVRALSAEKNLERRREMLTKMELSKPTEARVERMISSTDELAMLARICSEGGRDAKETTVRYIEQGAPRQVFAIAKNPQMLGAEGSR